MENLNLVELSQQEQSQVEGGFGPLYYLIVGAWGLGVAYGFVTAP